MKTLSETLQVLENDGIIFNLYIFDKKDNTYNPTNGAYGVFKPNTPFRIETHSLKDGLAQSILPVRIIKNDDGSITYEEIKLHQGYSSRLYFKIGDDGYTSWPYNTKRLLVRYDNENFAIYDVSLIFRQLVEKNGYLVYDAKCLKSKAYFWVQKVFEGCVKLDQTNNEIVVFGENWHFFKELLGTPKSLLKSIETEIDFNKFIRSKPEINFIAELFKGCQLQESPMTREEYNQKQSKEFNSLASVGNEPITLPTTATILSANHAMGIASAITKDGVVMRIHYSKAYVGQNIPVDGFWAPEPGDQIQVLLVAKTPQKPGARYEVLYEITELRLLQNE